MQVGIVGASIAGLSVANVLHRHGFHVTVFEAFGSGFQNRGGAVGHVDTDLINSIRHGKNFKKSNFLFDNPERIGVFYGSVWKFLYDGLPKGSVQFGAPVASLQDAFAERPKIVLEDGTVHPFDFIVGADGGRSVVRSYVVGEENAQGTFAGYVLYRGLLDGKEARSPPRGTADFGIYHYATLGYPCRNESGDLLWNCGMYLPFPEELVTRTMARNRQVGCTKKVPEWFLPLTKRLFPNKASVDFWTACVEKGKVSQHPVYEFAANRVTRDHVLIVGDAAHMISPRTGSGAYSAMLDAMALEDALEGSKCILGQCWKDYEEDGRERAQQFYRLSLRKKREFMPVHIFDAPSPEELLKVEPEEVHHSSFWYN